jgi:hypothetical protein
MPSYTNLQHLVTLKLLKELADKALEMCTNAWLNLGYVLINSTRVAGDEDRTSGRHYLFLTYHGLVYTRYAYKRYGFLNLCSRSVGEFATKIGEDRYAEMVDVFGLGPKDLSDALAKLADPFEGDAQP